MASSSDDGGAIGGRAADPLIGGVLHLGEVAMRVEAAVPTEGRAATYRVRCGDRIGLLKLARDIPPQNDLVSGLRNEALVLRALAGSGADDLPRLLGAGASVDGGFGVVTRWIDGVPLAPEGAATVRRRRLVAVGRALGRVHAAGFVHADVRPGNVLVRADGERVVLVDFDAAVAIGQCQSAFVGAPSFAPPEQLRGAPLGPPADVHAFAATIRRILPSAALAPGSALGATVAAATLPRPEERPSLTSLLEALAAAQDGL